MIANRVPIMTPIARVMPTTVQIWGFSQIDSGSRLANVRGRGNGNPDGWVTCDPPPAD